MLSGALFHLFKSLDLCCVPVVVSLCSPIVSQARLGAYGSHDTAISTHPLSGCLKLASPAHFWGGAHPCGVELCGLLVKDTRPAGGLWLAHTTYQDGPLSLPVRVPVLCGHCPVGVEGASRHYVRRLAGVLPAARLSTSRACPPAVESQSHRSSRQRLLQLLRQHKQMRLARIPARALFASKHAKLEGIHLPRTSHARLTLLGGVGWACSTGVCVCRGSEFALLAAHRRATGKSLFL